MNRNLTFKAKMAHRSVHKTVPMESSKGREAELTTTTTNQSFGAAFAAERSEQAEFDLTLSTPGEEKARPGSGQCGTDGAIDVDMVSADAMKTRKPPAVKVRWSVSSKLAVIRLGERLLTTPLLFFFCSCRSIR